MSSSKESEVILLKITIEGEAKEIAELVMQIQTRHEFDGISGRSGSLSKGIEDALNSMERSSFGGSK